MREHCCACTVINCTANILCSVFTYANIAIIYTTVCIGRYIGVCIYNTSVCIVYKTVLVDTTICIVYKTAYINYKTVLVDTSVCITAYTFAAQVYASIAIVILANVYAVIQTFCNRLRAQAYITVVSCIATQ